MKCRGELKIGDRVLALLTLGYVVGYSSDDPNRVWVALDTDVMQSFHFAECYHERDVVVRDEAAT